LTETDRLNAALVRFARDTAGYETLPDLLRGIGERLRGCAPFDHLGLALHRRETDSLELVLVEPPDLPPIPSVSQPDFPLSDVFRLQRTQTFVLWGDGPLPGVQPLLREWGFRSLCMTPVTTPRRPIGVLAFGSRSLDAYSHDDATRFEQIGLQVAVAVEHVMQVERLEKLGQGIARERDRSALLLRLTNAIVSELDLRALLAVISRELERTIVHHYASITLWDPDLKRLRREALVTRAGTTHLHSGALVREGPTLPSLAYEEGRTITASSADIDRMGTQGEIMRAEGFRSACSVPLQTARGRYGALNFASPNDDDFPPDEVALLEQVAAQMAMAIENATQYERADRFRREALSQRDRLGLLLQVNNELVTQRDSHSLRLSVLFAVRRIVPHDYASLTIYDSATRELRIVAMTYYDDRGVMEPSILLPLDRSPAGATLQRGVPSTFTGAELDQFDIDGIPTLKSAGLQTIACVPLVTRRGGLGTLNVASKAPNAFSQADVDLLVEVAGQVAIAVENTLAYQEISELKDKLAEEKLYLEDEITRQQGFEDIIGSSSALAAVLQQIRTVAPTDATVLLLGETGTGKELLARAVHTLSRRVERTFVRLNIAALPAALVESELFGYEKGAFTGAIAAKAGRLEIANRGTLFLDEVGDIPLEVQPKLLRALQEQEFERLGSSKSQKVDVRLIAATNRNLEEMVATGTFRSDLFYRLNVFPIRVPALRDRPEDVPALVQHFVAKFSREMGRRIQTIPAATMDALRRWHWPGNIRELENVIERAVILSTGPVLQVPLGALQPGLRAAPAAAPAPRAADPIPAYAQGEREMILKALREAGGVVAGEDGAAARLGLKRTTLQSKMRKLGIKRPSW
jgi:formate hydrogenlyase transcriptional activator